MCPEIIRLELLDRIANSKCIEGELVVQDYQILFKALVADKHIETKWECIGRGTDADPFEERQYYVLTQTGKKYRIELRAKIDEHERQLLRDKKKEAKGERVALAQLLVGVCAVLVALFVGLLQCSRHVVEEPKVPVNIQHPAKTQDKEKQKEELLNADDNLPSSDDILLPCHDVLTPSSFFVQ